MNYGIIRVQKMTKGAVQGIKIHDKREKDSLTNPDIDKTKICLNYDLSENNKTYHELIKDRISSLDLKKSVRKDAIVMVQVMVTSDHSFFEGISQEKQKKFFKDSFDFIKDFYGESNVFSGMVHLDEKTPHMHVNFVPVTTDNRLCAKDVLSRHKLIKMHDQFHEKVGENYGLKRGEKGGQKKHLETREYKELVAECQGLEEKCSGMLLKAVEEKKGIEVLESEKRRLNGQIEDLKGKLKGVLLTKKGIDKINPEKGTLGGVKNVSLDDIENLKKTAMKYPEAKEINNNLEFEIKRLKSEIKELRKKIPTMKEKMNNAKNKQKLEQLEKIVAELPTDLLKKDKIKQFEI